MMNTANKVTLECGRCSGSGKFYFSASETGPCFGCSGSGKVTMSAAKHAAMLASAERMAAARALETAAEIEEDEAFQAATAMIESNGVEGARSFFRANRTNATALVGLICAMRNAQMNDEANAVVRYRNSMADRRGRA